MPSSRHARMMRTAISPRLAIRMRSNIARLSRRGRLTDALTHGELLIALPRGRALLEKCAHAFLCFRRRAARGDRLGHQPLHVPRWPEPGLAQQLLRLSDRAGT